MQIENCKFRDLELAYGGRPVTELEGETYDNFANNRSSTVRARNLQFAICNLQFAISVLAGLFCSTALAASSPPPSDPLIRKAPTWHPPQVADVKAQVAAWLQQNAADAALRSKAAGGRQGHRRSGHRLRVARPPGRDLCPGRSQGGAACGNLLASPQPPGPADLRLLDRCQDAAAGGRQHAAVLRPLARPGAVVRRGPGATRRPEDGRRRGPRRTALLPGRDLPSHAQQGGRAQGHQSVARRRRGQPAALRRRRLPDASRSQRLGKGNAR